MCGGGLCVSVCFVRVEGAEGVGEVDRGSEEIVVHFRF